MSERLTSIALPGVFGAGLADWGRKTPAEMVELIRVHAAQNKATAEAILSAKDDDFYVCTYLGVHAQRDREVLQPGKSP